MELPVFKIREKLEKCVQDGGRVLLKAPTGSGKSTGVPVMLLETGEINGMIIVVQPRRIAARLLAGFVASLMEAKWARRWVMLCGLMPATMRVVKSFT